MIGDLRSAVETHGVAEQVNAIGRMDAVIHNAGVYRTRGREPTPEGHSTILAVNTLAPFVLTALIERPLRLVYLSSGLHRSGTGPLRDIDFIARPWDTPRAYNESKLHVVALAFAIARRWPDVLSNAVDPGWARTRMGGSSAPVSVNEGQRTQSWLAISDEPAAKVSGRYWRKMHAERAAPEATDVTYQEELVAALTAFTGVELP